MNDNINKGRLIAALSKKFGQRIVSADYSAKQLQGGTIGSVALLTGTAINERSEALPYKIVFKTHKKYDRYADLNSWRREYELYASDFGNIFMDELRWPDCYHAEISETEFEIWLEYIEGVSGEELNIDELEQAAMALGRFQGRLYARPDLLKNIDCFSALDYMEKDFYGWHQQIYSYEHLIAKECPMPEHIKQMYIDNKAIIDHEKTVEYNCLRFPECDLPDNIKQMLINLDENKESIFSNIKALPVVLCHRDFWVTNIFVAGSDTILIDWDTTGFGYLGEDIASLIVDRDTNFDCIGEYYHRLIPAYFKGLSAHMDTSIIKNNYILEMMLIKFGYRYVQSYMFTESKDTKGEELIKLQNIYELFAENAILI